MYSIWCDIQKTTLDNCHKHCVISMINLVCIQYLYPFEVQHWFDETDENVTNNREIV